MALFQYKGVTKAGKEVKDTINCENEIIAKQKLKAKGIILLSIKEKKSKAKSDSAISFGSGVNVNDLAMMTRQLATLIKAKIQIVEALGALTNQVDNPTLKVVLAELRSKVNEGSALSKALSDYPKVFDTVYVNMVDAGEKSGNLEIVLLRLAEFTEAQVKLKNRLKGAMIYPVLMACFGAIMMNFIFIFVIPKIAKIFESMKKELPITTKACIAISKFMVSYWWVVIIVIFLSVIIIRKYISTPGGERKWHTLQLKLPKLGSLVKMINVSRFSSTLATLLNSGVNILTALNIVKNLIPNVVMKDSVEAAREAVKKGESIAGPLIASGNFPSLVTHMIKLGESSGELEDMLKIVAENYEDQVDAEIGGLTSVLEPIMMIGMGVAVGFIVFSVIMPMMSLNSMH